MRKSRILQLAAVSVVMAGLVPVTPNLASGMPADEAAGDTRQVAKWCMPLPPPRAFKTPGGTVRPATIKPIQPRSSSPQLRPMNRLS